MTTMMPVASTDATLGTVLAARHEDWMQRVAAVLIPALDERADLWTRWAVARYLDDRFGDRFRLECALVDALDEWLSPETARSLAAAREVIERTGQELIAAGRRQRSRSETARLARRFVDQLALWCVEVEIATDGIPMDEISGEVHRLLARLQLADVVWR